MELPKNVCASLADKKLIVDETKKLLAYAHVADDNLTWRFLAEMLENSCRANAVIQLDYSEDGREGNKTWYIIEGMGMGEKFLYIDCSKADTPNWEYSWSAIYDLRDEN